MSATFATRSLYDPLTIAESNLVPAEKKGWLKQANSFYCPTGTKPGIGFLLMSRQDLDTLDLSLRHSLKFQDYSTKSSIVILNLAVVDAVAITPSSRGDKNTLYCVRVADRRNMWPLYLVNKSFNLKLTPIGNYRPEDLVGSEPKTWQDMIDEIWEVLPESATHDAPTLPATPDGNPDGFDFFGVTADVALQQVLDRLGCELAYDPITDEFAIEAIGDSEAKSLYDQAIASMDSLRVRIDDDERIVGNLGRIPRSVTILFPIDPPPAYGENPYHSIEILDSGTVVPGQEEGTTVPLIDDATANYQGETLLNEIDLEARAEARAVEYFQSLRKTGPAAARMTFAGLQTAFAIGGWVNQYEWRDKGDGFQTEVWIHDSRKIQKWTGNKAQVWRETEVIRLAGTTTSVAISGSGSVTFFDGIVERRDELTNVVEDRFECLVRCDADAGETCEVVGKWIGHVEGKPVYFAGKTGSPAECQSVLKGPIAAIPGYSALVAQALTHSVGGCLQWTDIAACGSGSGSGSDGSGGGGDGETVTVSCCGNPLPTTLYLIPAGDYAYLGALPLTWIGGAWVTGDGSDWITLTCGPQVRFTLYCGVGSFWRVGIAIQGTFPDTISPALTATSCDPLLLEGTLTINDGGCTEDMPITVTETAP